MFIHNPSTIAIGEQRDMESAAQMLHSVKESIMNAYELKTGLNRTKISAFMDEEHNFDVNEAMKYGFADGMLYAERAATAAGKTLVSNSLAGALGRKRPAPTGTPVTSLTQRLNLLKF
jgi:ATP-dependent Clp protease protease subunit